MSCPIKNDPEKYLRLSEPRTPDDANAAVEAFFSDLGAIREKHGFPDIITVIGMNVRYEGGVGRGVTWVQCGDGNNAESMLAFGLGQAQADRRETINRLMAGKKQ